METEAPGNPASPVLCSSEPLPLPETTQCEDKHVKLGSLSAKEHIAKINKITASTSAGLSAKIPNPLKKRISMAPERLPLILRRRKIASEATSVLNEGIQSTLTVNRSAVNQPTQFYTKKIREPNSAYYCSPAEDLINFREYSPNAQPVFRCIYCGFLFLHFNTARIHALDNHKKKIGNTLSCRICTYTAVSWDNLVNHIISNHYIEYKNNKTSEVFASVRIFMSFVSTVEANEICKSTFCDFASLDKNAVNKHEFTHRFKCEFMCHKCSLVFKDSDRLSFDQHMASCPTSRFLPNLQCESCGFSTFDYNILENHRNSEPSHLHTCPGCKVAFKSIPALVTKHFPTCSSMSRKPEKKNMTEDQDWIQNAKKKISRINPTGCNEAPKSTLESKLDRLMGERLNLSFHDMAEILVLGGNQCRSCHQLISSDSELLAHFIIHFSPCCRICSVKEGQVCTIHGQWYILNPEYFDKLSQHSFALAKDTLMCKNCDVTIQNEQVNSYISTVSSCPDCSYFGTKQAAFFHLLQHKLWKFCQTCNFLTSSSESFQAHIKDCQLNPRSENCASCNSKVDEEFHQLHCVAAFIHQIEAQDKTSSQKDQLLGICKPLMPLVCKICQEKFYSEYELALHTEHHPVYHCHLCFVFTDLVQEHYTIEHPDFSDKFTNPNSLLDLADELKNPIFEFMAKCALMGTTDVSRLLQTQKNTCLVCTRPAIKGSEVLEHFSLHFSPCCSKCTELGEDKRCETHSKPLFLHQTNYLSKLTQHNFVYIAIFKYICKNCNLIVTKLSGASIYRRFLQCSQCNFFTRVGNSSRLVAHMMSHIALTVCNFASCVENIQSSEEYNCHMKTHIKRLSCSCCYLTISGTMKDLVEHEITCRAVLLDVYSHIPKSEDYIEMMKNVLVQRERCRRCTVNHEYDIHCHTMFPFLRVCPLCEQTFNSLELERHFYTNHQGFLAYATKRLQINGHPEENFGTVKKMWKRWLEEIDVPPPRETSDVGGHNIEGNESSELNGVDIPVFERTGEKSEEMNKDFIKFRVKAFENERILELSFTEEK